MSLTFSADAGWLLSGHEPLERIADQDAACGDPDLSFKRTYQEVFNLELFHALPHHPALEHVMKLVVGEHPLIHPKPIGRLIFPHRENLTVHAHQDHRFMDGDRNALRSGFPCMTAPSAWARCKFWRALIVSVLSIMNTRTCMFRRSQRGFVTKHLGRGANRRRRCADFP